MNEACLILDVAHGQLVKGKRSPDNVFEEWAWSRERVKDIYEGLTDFELSFDVYSPFLSYRNEPGLRNRVRTYNTYAESYRDTIMLSLHVDAFKDPPEWWDGTGFSFFTNRIENTADELANVMAEVWETEMPEERIRRNRQKDVSKDRNFTVIWGYSDGKEYVPANYHGILVENLFMDNKKDVYNKLMDGRWNLQLTNTYLIAIFEMFEYLGYQSSF